MGIDEPAILNGEVEKESEPALSADMQATLDEFNKRPTDRFLNQPTSEQERRIPHVRITFRL
jgi:hypothetical protein